MSILKSTKSFEAALLNDQERSTEARPKREALNTRLQAEYRQPLKAKWLAFEQAVIERSAPVDTRETALALCYSPAWVAGVAHLTGYILRRNYGALVNRSGAEANGDTHRQRMDDLKSMIVLTYLILAGQVCKMTDFTQGTVTEANLLQAIAVKISVRAKFLPRDDKSVDLICIPDPDSRSVVSKIIKEEVRLARKLTLVEILALRFPRRPALIRLSETREGEDGSVMSTEIDPAEVDEAWRPDVQTGEQALIRTEDEARSQKDTQIRWNILADRQQEVEGMQFDKVRNAAFTEFYDLILKGEATYGRAADIARKHGVQIADIEQEKALLMNRYRAAVARELPDIHAARELAKRQRRERVARQAARKKRGGPADQDQ